LLQAFTELIKEKGFRSITVQDITERATVNRATFYAHFEDKYAVLDSFIREMFQQHLSATVSPSSDLSRPNLRLLILSVFAYLDQSFYARHKECAALYREFEPLITTAVQDELYRFILAWIEHGLPVGAPRPEAPEVTATVWSWAIFGAGVQWTRGDRSRSAEDTADQVAALLTGSVGAVAEPAFPDRRERQREGHGLEMGNGRR
jgi:AcrR family transcriptional regulator